jgi:alkylation response protein AidB-like acyl-CoA dehydrogenase
MPLHSPICGFVLDEVAELDELAQMPGYEAASADLVEAILEEAAKLAGNELAPLNQPGDRAGSVLENGVVRTPAGFARPMPDMSTAAGTGSPSTANMAAKACRSLSPSRWRRCGTPPVGFALCPLLTGGAVELLQAHGSDEQKQRYLAKLVSGEWTGTMNLTEPQAGSDLGALRTRAMPAHDPRWGEHYRITGQKIFITYGDHVLVPKFLPEDEGGPGARNDVRTLSLEHKLDIHASPTCVLACGEDEGAIGWRIGEENRIHVHGDERRPAQCRAAGCGNRRARLPTGSRLRPDPGAGSAPRRRTE